MRRRGGSGVRQHRSMTLLNRHLPRGTGTSRRGAPLAHRASATTEDDLNYYYDQIETCWLAGYATTFEQIHDHLPATERGHLTEGLGALLARNWLKLEELPIRDGEHSIDCQTCYVPVRQTGTLRVETLSMSS